MAGVAQCFFDHVRGTGGFYQRAQSVAVKGFQCADAGEVDQFGIGKGGFHHKLSVLNITGGAGVFFNHIHGRKNRFVFIRPHPFYGKPAHVDHHPFGRVELVSGIARQDVAHSRCNADIGNHRDVVLFGKFIQFKKVFRKKSNVDHIFSGFDCRFQGLESHESRYGAQNEIKITHNRFDRFG